MGLAIDKEFFEPKDYELYWEKVHNQLSQLKTILQDRSFSQGPRMLGCEVEFSLIDESYRPKCCNLAVVDKLGDDECQVELNQFNLEYNFKPHQIAGSPFSYLEDKILHKFQGMNEAANAFGAQAVMVGILPTISEKDVQGEYMTDVPRYRALSRGVKKMHQGSFKININGVETLQTESEDLTLEGANTSIQLHIQVQNDEFVDWYNAIQMATPLAVAISGNSPIFLEKLLWDETRIAVFKQAIESRRDDTSKGWRQPNRVSYGYGWLRRSAWEYFAELVHLYEPLLPVMIPTDEMHQPPQLFEFKLHQGTLWRWNRGIYDATDKGHLRIEMRSLPTGPTAKDMVASGAFLIGLASYLKSQIHDLLPAFPFMFSEYNFYRAAQKGFDANLLWPQLGSHSPKEFTAHELAANCVPLAYEGLGLLGVDAHEVETWLGLVKEKIKHQKSGSNWMRQTLAKVDKGDRTQALRDMLKLYVSNMQENKSILSW